MPEQFYQPIGLPRSLQGNFKPSPRFKAGYTNIYGTNVEGGYEPETNTGTLNINFPIGSHQSGIGLNARGYTRPGINGTSDYGGFIGISKKITPEIENRQVIQRIARETGIRSEDLNPYQNASYPNDEFAKEFAKRFAKTKSKLIDEQMGIRPGAEKYSFGFGADVKNIPMQSLGDNLTGMYRMPTQFNQSPPGYNQYIPPQSNGFPSNYDQSLPHQLKDTLNQNTPQIYGMNQ